MMPETMQADDRYVIPSGHLEVVSGWGLASSTVAYVYRPHAISELAEVFTVARRTGRTVAFRGAGQSYGDAAQNAENIILDLTGCSRIISWNPITGVLIAEAGVTIRQIWQQTLPDGWWPPVVPGTMFPTLAGCAAMNIHGKNNFNAGTIGDHILSFEMLTPTGEAYHCSRQENPLFFHAMIGGFGMLGCFTTITLQLHRVDSGYLDVRSTTVRSLREMMDSFEERAPRADYLVGWIDAFAHGRSLGRGVLHQANYLAPGVDSDPATTLSVEHQQLPTRILSTVPKTVLWRLMRPFTNDPGVRLVNAMKYRSAQVRAGSRILRQSHVGFAFLLDYVPDWRRAYGSGGLIQYQSFIPFETAHDAFAEQLRHVQKSGHRSYLAVFKQHRRDNFLMSHGVDGYSLALDFRITSANRGDIWKLAGELDRIVLDAGGRFYFAKDSTLGADAAQQYLGSEAVAEFRRIKNLCDPEGILETNLYRRLFSS